MSSVAPAETQEHTTVCLPIIYGSIAFFLDKKKSDEYHTHRWTLYVRGPNDEDLSVGIAKVVFQLHPSFPQPVRELTAPPFEVTEKGWGEFEATIRIVWRDPDEKATVLTHGIKLYPPGATNITKDSKSKEPVVHEFYDEVVFTNPKESFHRQLMRTSEVPRIKSHEPSVQEIFPVYSDEADVKALLEAQKFLEAEIGNVKNRLLTADEEVVELEDALALIAQAKAEAAAARSAAAAAAVTASSSSGKGYGGKHKSGGGGSTAKKSKSSH
mmetsp:Transcript_37478/g.112396  ORF Transcript_37478/g.112396 Transcript_37478/m.112396 type:complete len:270 (-) Transcript_37478:124-933(-)|eukprot:CAMPEP_0113566302 /NCGR_PEP_ID=MMETSP0015_2-20120614/22649_1 /TAXON_ID=2838 /ORGANISM="Odontella" /LENGTH=269 /DNA_ID=CAMNT_0000468579 /DNA_START=246 /DNA_END=1055 /DNA_ORIENTATION=+ /assembly_acc=CAM_ASM_000160